MMVGCFPMIFQWFSCSLIAIPETVELKDQAAQKQLENQRKQAEKIVRHPRVKTIDRKAMVENLPKDINKWWLIFFVASLLLATKAVEN